MDAIRPFLARFVGILVAWAAGQLAIRWGVVVDDAMQAELAEQILNLITIFMGLYVATHRYASKLSNPGDAASSHLAVHEKEQTRELKAEVK